MILPGAFFWARFFSFGIDLASGERIKWAASKQTAMHDAFFPFNITYKIEANRHTAQDHSEIWSGWGVGFPSFNDVASQEKKSVESLS